MSALPRTATGWVWLFARANVPARRLSLTGLAALRERIELLKYATMRQISVDEAKVALARDTIKLGLQRELAGKDGEGPQVATPPTEPEGRAAEGRAYQA